MHAASDLSAGTASDSHLRGMAAYCADACLALKGLLGAPQDVDVAGMGIKEFGPQRAEKEEERMKLIMPTLAALLYVACTTAAAQGGRQPWEEYDKFIQSRHTVSAHGPDLFGDRVNAYNNTLSFSVTDISLPGNSSLPVALTRTFDVVTRNYYAVNASSIADWGLDHDASGRSGWRRIGANQGL